MQDQTTADFWRYVGILKRWSRFLILVTVLASGFDQEEQLLECLLVVAQRVAYVDITGAQGSGPQRLRASAGTMLFPFFTSPLRLPPEGPRLGHSLA